MAIDVGVIRDVICTELETAGADNVYTADPRLEDWDAVVDLLRQGNSQYIQCWVVRRVSSLPRTSETDFGRVPIGCAVFWDHTFDIKMFFGYLENSSEDQMQDLIDSVLSHFQTKRTLSDLVFGIRRPLALARLEPRELGGIGGFEALFNLTVEEHQTGLTPS